MNAFHMQWIFDNCTDLSLAEKAVLMGMGCIANDDHLCWFTQEQLSEKICCNRKTIWKSLKALRDKGYIVKRPEKKGKRNEVDVYELKCLEFLKGKTYEHMAQDSSPIQIPSQEQKQETSPINAGKNTIPKSGIHKDNLTIPKNGIPPNLGIPKTEYIAKTGEQQVIECKSEPISNNVTMPKSGISYNKKENISLNNTPPKPPLPSENKIFGGVCVDDGSFERFWESYPAHRRSAIGWCKQTWLIRGYTAKDAERFIADIKNRLTNCHSWSRGYVNGIRSYLQDELWNTAITPKPKSGKDSIMPEKPLHERLKEEAIARELAAKAEKEEEIRQAKIARQYLAKALSEREAANKASEPISIPAKNKSAKERPKNLLSASLGWAVAS